jgi:hypothetical protein
MALLEKSMRKNGFVEAGLISEDGVICSGNARQETAVNIGLEDVQIIDIDGTKPVYLRKKGLLSGTKEFKEIALQLNAVANANIVLDAELITEEIGEGVCEAWGVEVQDKITSNDFGTDFTLKNGDKEPFQQMTFTLANQQATVIKNAIYDIKATDEYKYAEIMGNENSNGNALYLIVASWAGQRK